MSNVPSKNNRIEQETADQKMIDGLNKHAATITTLVIGGKPLTPATLVTTLQARLATASAAQSTRSAWLTAVAADKAEHTNTETLVAGLRQAIPVAFAGSIDDLADFGLTPHKQAVISPETRIAAAAKAKATRKARGTLGRSRSSRSRGPPRRPPRPRLLPNEHRGWPASNVTKALLADLHVSEPGPAGTARSPR
jgi:hypothetical protein